MIAFIEDVGISIIRFFEYIGGLLTLFWESLIFIAKGAMKFRLTVEQMAILGVNSIAIVVITTGFAGMVLSLELALQAVRYGVGRFVGGGVALSMAREFGPMLTAIVVAGRAGSAITAELGSMKVTEQIDALQAMGVSPVRYLVVPRLIACLIMIPILTLFADIAGTMGGAAIANLHAGISSQIYFDSISNMVVMSDLWAGLIKALVFAGEIAMVACHQGLATTRGAAGVGTATTGSVVYSIIIIFISNYFLSAWLF
jgi:phospholipid/cholesterol/gamma-HCH transport system permease protein